MAISYIITQSSILYSVHFYHCIHDKMTTVDSLKTVTSMPVLKSALNKTFT